MMSPIAYAIQDDSATPNPSAAPANMRRRNAATLAEVFHSAGMRFRQIKTI